MTDCVRRTVGRPSRLPGMDGPIDPDALRHAARDWRAAAWRRRRAVLRRFRQALVNATAELHTGVPIPSRTLTQTTVAEVLPLAAACRWLERHGRRTLRDRRLRLIRRPGWLPGVHGRVVREPHGAVLILGTWNYPIFLTGVQLLQALAAGNAVAIKPGRDCRRVSERLAWMLRDAGLPEGLLRVLDDSAATGEQAVAAGFDYIVLTGSAATGRKVLHAAAQTLTPCTVELSGSDAVLVGEDADVERAARCVAFGLSFNGGATCIAPRRVFVPDALADEFLAKLHEHLSDVVVPPSLRQAAVPLVADALRRGATPGVPPRGTASDGETAPAAALPESRSPSKPTPPVVLDRCTPEMRLLHSDVFAPVLAVVRCVDHADMLTKASACPYALGASVFGSDPALLSVPAGCVTVNDLIVPTADPRVPFGGRGESGYGVTRGPEGLLAMTRPRVILRRRGTALPHLDPPHETDADLLGGAAQVRYGDWATKWLGLKRTFAAGRRRSTGG